MASNDTPPARRRRRGPPFFADHNFVGDFLGGDDDSQKSAHRAGDGYYLGADRITPSRFARLSTAKQAAVMVEWFATRYEDPVHSLSYNSREGGYLWSDGPYDASEVLEGEFGSLAKERALERAVEQITANGTYEWAPVRNNDIDDGIYSTEEPFPDISDVDIDDEAAQLPDLLPGQSYLTDGNHRILAFDQGRGAVGATSLNEHEINGPTSAGIESSFAAGPVSPNQEGDIKALRAEMNNRLDNLEALVRQQLNIAPNRGHNRPPELLDVERPVTQAQLAEVAIAIDEIRKEADNPAPTPANVVAQVSVFQRIAVFLKSGLGFVAAAAASGVIGDIAVGAYKTHAHAFYEAIVKAADAVLAWVQHLPSPF